jgi:hypothetical protein
MKMCSKCGSLKELSDFYKHSGRPDGLSCQCRDCLNDYRNTHKAQIANQKRRWVLKNKEHVKRHRAEFYLANKAAINALSKDYRRQNSARLVKKASLYAKEHPEAIRRIKANWKLRNTEKTRAGWCVSNAIRDGRMARQDCCVCGTPNAEAHHDDYDKPLSVIWLCKLHHEERHHA